MPFVDLSTIFTICLERLSRHFCRFNYPSLRSKTDEDDNYAETFCVSMAIVVRINSYLKLLICSLFNKTGSCCTVHMSSTIHNLSSLSSKPSSPTVAERCNTVEDRIQPLRYFEIQCSYLRCVATSIAFVILYTECRNNY